MQRQNKKRYILLLMGLLMLFNSGCFGGRETDQVALVIAVGLDKGKKEALEMTVVIANPLAFATGDGGAGDAEPFFITSVEGPTVWECYTLLNTYVSRELTLHHTNAYIFGEELSRSGLRPYIMALLRQREVRRGSHVFICNGKAKEFLKTNKPMLEIFPGKLFDLMSFLSERTGFVSDRDLHDAYLTMNNLHSSATLPMVGVQKEEEQRTERDARESLKAPYLPGDIPREGGNKVEFVGTAVFNNDKMVGKLTADENRTMLLLQGRLISSNFSFEDPGKSGRMIAVALNQAKAPDIRFTLDNNRLIINQTVFLEGEIFSIQSGINYENPKQKWIIEDALEKTQENLARKLIQKSKDEGWGDIFRYDTRYRRELSTWEEWRNLPWKEMYMQAEINVDVKANFRRTGLLRTTEPMVEGN